MRKCRARYINEFADMPYIEDHSLAAAAAVYERGCMPYWEAYAEDSGIKKYE